MDKFTFDTIEYIRPDIAAVEAEVRALTEELKNATSYAQVKDLLLRSDKATEDMGTMITVAHVRNTLNTTDKFYEDEMAYLQQALPVAQVTFMGFEKALLESPFTAELDADLGPEYLTSVRRSLSSFNETLVPYLQEQAKLTTEYQKLMATAQIEFDGQVLNLYGIQKYFEHPDRRVRKEAFAKYSQFYASNEEKMEEIFDQLVKIRTAMGKAMRVDTLTPLG